MNTALNFEGSWAQSQLESKGWKSGQGLGKSRSGRSSAIKVSFKNSKTGMGHDPGEEFTVQWWEHGFNKAAGKVKVVADENGARIESQSTATLGANARTLDNKNLLYSRFIKAGTLNPSHLSDPSQAILEGESVPDRFVNRFNTQAPEADRLTDEQIFKACGGLTAHKGARHGLKLSGKLKRLQEQEAALLEGIQFTNDVSNAASTSINGCSSATTNKKLSQSKKRKKQKCDDRKKMKSKREAEQNDTVDDSKRLSIEETNCISESNESIGESHSVEKGAEQSHIPCKGSLDGKLKKKKKSKVKENLDEEVKRKKKSKVKENLDEEVKRKKKSKITADFTKESEKPSTNGNAAPHAKAKGKILKRKQDHSEEDNNAGKSKKLKKDKGVVSEANTEKGSDIGVVRKESSGSKRDKQKKKQRVEIDKTASETDKKEMCVEIAKKSKIERYSTDSQGPISFKKVSVKREKAEEKSKRKAKKVEETEVADIQTSGNCEEVSEQQKKAKHKAKRNIGKVEETSIESSAKKKTLGKSKGKKLKVIEQKERFSSKNRAIGEGVYCTL